MVNYINFRYICFFQFLCSKIESILRKIQRGVNLKKSVFYKIKRLKNEKNALILSHFYQRSEVQDVADFVGDSLELARIASEAQEEVIVFCGVDFMAQTAYILSPSKTILLPKTEASCPLANMISANELQSLKQLYPDAKVVSYVNTTAEVKALSDFCCTSSNAQRVVNSISSNSRIIFVPDKNLGLYIKEKTGRDLVLWDGYCPIHNRLTVEEVESAKNRHPEALVLAHPECRMDVLKLADFVGSTSAMVNYVQDSISKEYIICTESGVINRMKKICPQKKFYSVCSNFVCKNMKLTSLEDVLISLETMEPKITISEEIRSKAFSPISRMMNI